MVASGPVDELRSAHSGRRLRVGSAAADGWADGLPGVIAAEYGAGSAILTLTPEADDQVVLDAVRALGPVREFTPLELSLAELFREAVAEDPAAALEFEGAAS
jgi:ABC-2 type transport system ATP-binding protein